MESLRKISEIQHDTQMTESTGLGRILWKWRRQEEKTLSMKKKGKYQAEEL